MYVGERKLANWDDEKQQMLQEILDEIEEEDRSK